MKHSLVATLVTQTYHSSTQPFAQWVFPNHVQVVVKKAEELSRQFGANPDLAVAGAWLHDFGDAFVPRHDSEHEQISKTEAITVLQKVDYTPEEITEILEEIIGPHSCKDGNIPTTLEGKVLATADALAHLTTNFYLQFAWMHLPEGKTYSEFVNWVNQKLDCDFHDKIFFEEMRVEVKKRYEILKEVFADVSTHR